MIRLKTPHFFKAKSSLGSLYPLRGREEVNLGVRDAPDHILPAKFLDQFSHASIDSFTFPGAREVTRTELITHLARSFKDFRSLITQSMGRDDRQVVVGGDHSITLASVQSILDKIGDTASLGYIQFDSHGDMNLWATSPSDNFHGMFARSLVDRFDIPEIDQLVPLKIPVKNVLFIGNLDLDPEEKQFFRQQGFGNITQPQISWDKETILADLANFVFSFPYLHVSFDIDCLDKSAAPATGLPAEDGLALKDVVSLLKVIARHPSLSFDLAEVNPQKDGSRKTIAVAQRILCTILDKRSESL